jgi:hypothetical protein
MTQRIKALLGATLIALGLVVAVPAPASASFSQCNALAVEICGWENVNWGGVHRKFTGTRYVCYTLQGQYFDQKLSSVWNHRPLEELRLYSGNACGGNMLIINPNSGSSNLGTVGGGWNDVARSWSIAWD